MDPRTSSSRYILTSLAIILVITAFILVGLNALRLQSLGSETQDVTEAYRQGYLAAQAQDALRCPILTQDQKHFSATIISKSSDSIVVQSNQFNADQTLGLQNTRVIQITRATTFINIIQKSATELSQEAASKKDNSTPPPSPYHTQTISFDDLKVGGTIDVSVAEDARTNTQLSALQISTQ